MFTRLTEMSIVASRAQALDRRYAIHARCTMLTWVAHAFVDVWKIIKPLHENLSNISHVITAYRN